MLYTLHGPVWYYQLGCLVDCITIVGKNGTHIIILLVSGIAAWLSTVGFCPLVAVTVSVLVGLTLAGAELLTRS